MGDRLGEGAGVVKTLAELINMDGLLPPIFVAALDLVEHGSLRSVCSRAMLNQRRKETLNGQW